MKYIIYLILSVVLSYMIYYQFTHIDQTELRNAIDMWYLYPVVIGCIFYLYKKKE